MQQENRKRKANCDDDDDNTVQGTTIQTPKRARPATTPLKFVHSAEVDPYHSPSIVRSLQFTPSHLRAVGPTPQRDGKVLGIFDLLDDEDDDHHVREGERIPRKDDDDPERSTNLCRSSRQSTTATTTTTTTNGHLPSRTLFQISTLLLLRYGRTPASSGRRFFLDMFVSSIEPMTTTKEEEDQRRLFFVKTDDEDRRCNMTRTVNRKSILPFSLAPFACL